MPNGDGTGPQGTGRPGKGKNAGQRKGKGRGMCLSRTAQSNE